MEAASLVELVAPEADILAEIVLAYDDNSKLVDEGTCSCVCINDEQCCGCLLQ